MANGKSIKTLRKVVEGEHLAANALAVAIGKVKESDLQHLLGQIRITHEENAEEAGRRLQALGGKYPIPGLRDQLKKGWEAVASTKSAADALKLLTKKERDALVNYKDLLKKAGDEQTMNVVLRNMADSTENVVKLREKLTEMQSKKSGKGGFLGIPGLVWLAALGGGGYYVYQQYFKSGGNPQPVPPANGNS